MRALGTCLAVVLASCTSSCTSGDPRVAPEPILDPLDSGIVDAAPEPALTEAQRATLDAYLEATRASHGWPSLAVAIVQGDTRVYAKGFGARDGAGEGPPIDGETVFRIGSVTKVVTGVAVLKLRDEGELRLDDAVETYVPELSTFLTGPSGTKVTIRHLVTHTSGIPSVGDGTAAYWKGDHDVTEAELFAALSGSSLEFEPGTAVAYSNFGVALAGVVVARVSGEPFRDRVDASIFQPLGMVSSVWSRDDVEPAFLARGHVLGVDGWTPGGAHWRLGAAEAAGGAYSTAADMARFLSFQARAHSSLEDLERVLSRASLRDAQTPDPKAPSDPRRFGVAWLTGEDALGRFVSHDGSVLDYAASVRLYPERRAGIVALVGAGDASSLDCATREALASLLAGSEPKACGPALSTWNAAALERVRSLIAAPTLAGIDEAFTPDFLASISRDELLAFFESSRATYGACLADVTVAAVSDAGTARIRLPCEKGTAAVLLGADAATKKLHTLAVKPWS